MSMDALISGRLCGKPQSRAGKSVATFVTAKLIARMANAENIHISVIAFGDTVKAALLGLEYGDSVAIAGEMKVGIFTDKEGIARPSLDLTAFKVMSARDVQGQRDLAAPEQVSA
jgi:single-stranded DNA-binding protein